MVTGKSIAHMGQEQTACPALEVQLISQPPLFMAPCTPPSHMFCGTHTDEVLCPPICGTAHGHQVHAGF